MPLTDTTLDAIGLELVEANIGGGGSASVHKCRVVRLATRLPPIGTFIAVKEYKPSLLVISGQLARIRQEADVGQKLNHPNIVRTFGLHEGDGSDSTTLLLLEWIDGSTLEGWYSAQKKPIAWEMLRSISLDLIGGVAELHKNNILHRDIKPENLMVRADGSAVVMDIGVAELTGDNNHTLHTLVKDFVGSVRYASPQFILGEGPFTPADDVYSIGATIFLPFTGTQIYHEVERKPVLPIIITNTPPKLSSLQDGIPASMKVLLQGCLHRDRKRRPTLEQIRECLGDPTGAPYITKELELQASESRGYTVLEVFDNGASFFADMAGDHPETDTDYRIVRPGNRLSVPSYQREVVPETWVGDAILKHVHANVGHFVSLGKRWQEGKMPFAGIANLVATPGQWVEFEKMAPTVRKGDLVLKKSH